MNNITKLIQLLSKILGDGFPSKNNTELKFYCPICNHRKQKLEVCIDPTSSDFQKWNCWVCGQTKKTRGNRLIDLFNKLNVHPELKKELNLILDSISPRKKEKIKSTNNINLFDSAEKKIEHLIQLPDEYLPLWTESSRINKASPEYKNALHYLKKRKVSDLDILRYKIGYAETGKYGGMIIIPNYNSFNQLDFFTARSYYDDVLLKHKNADIDKNNIIGFENQINWKLPITLVEGPFDAITVKRNVIPLYGKNILSKLKLKIVNENVKDIYLALDDDALLDAIYIMQYFIGNGINLYLVKLTKKDPAELGFVKFQELKNKANLITDCDLMKIKLNKKLNKK